MQTYELRQMQSLPLEQKIIKSSLRIREWYEYWDGQVYVSFSGGKDSTVLLHLVRQQFPDVPAVFVDTGLEFPAIRHFVQSVDNVIWLRPKMRFQQIVQEYGYPVVSKDIARSVYYARKGEQLGHPAFLRSEPGRFTFQVVFHPSGQMEKTPGCPFQNQRSLLSFHEGRTAEGDREGTQTIYWCYGRRKRQARVSLSQDGMQCFQ